MLGWWDDIELQFGMISNDIELQFGSGSFDAKCDQSSTRKQTIVV